MGNLKTRSTATSVSRSVLRGLWLGAVAGLAVAALLISGPAVSYGRALSAPGEASWSVRTVDWLRSSGLGPVINSIENWYYTRHPPSNTPPDPSTLPSQRGGIGSAKPTPSADGPTPLPPFPGQTSLPGENVWSAGRTDQHGRPLIYTSYFRPDAAHASVVAGVAWIRRTGSRAHLVAGTIQPGGGPWPGNASVPAGAISRLVATFNSGWRMQDIDGGFYLGGRASSRLVAGEATAAIDDRGQLTVGQCGRDLHWTSHLIAARQNLDLIVDRGNVVSGLDRNAHGRWGNPHNQLQYTARSGLGIDRHGNIIYVAGTGMNLAVLGQSLRSAGAVTAMELDIHKQMIHFSSWQPTRAGLVAPTKLLPAMRRKADRYLVSDQRDFFYITSAPSGQ